MKDVEAIAAFKVMKIKVIWPLKTAGKRTRESPSKAAKLKIAISSLFCLLFVASLLAGDSCEIVFWYRD